MIGKSTKVYTKLEAWLKTAGLADHELDVMTRGTNSQYHIFLDGSYFAEYDAPRGLLKLSDHCSLYQFQVHATEKAEYGKQYTMPAKAIIIEI